jgi:hypothetical protein
MSGNKMTNGVLSNTRASTFSESDGQRVGHNGEIGSVDNMEVGGGIGVGGGG